MFRKDFSKTRLFNRQRFIRCQKGPRASHLRFMLGHKNHGSHNDSFRIKPAVPFMTFNKNGFAFANYFAFTSFSISMTQPIYLTHAHTHTQTLTPTHTLSHSLWLNQDKSSFVLSRTESHDAGKVETCHC